MESVGPMSFLYGPRADILPARSRASLLNKRFIMQPKKALKVFRKTHEAQCPVKYLEDIGPAIEHFDWLILLMNAGGQGLTLSLCTYLQCVY